MFKTISVLLIQLLGSQPDAASSIEQDAMTFEVGEQPCSALGDGVIGRVASAMGLCSSDYCCKKCTTTGAAWTCYQCTAGSKCNGHVFACVGCYSGDSQCSIGTTGSNSCCD